MTEAAAETRGPAPTTPKKGPLAKKAYDSQVAWLRDLGLIA